MIITEAEQAYLEARRKQVEALKHIYPGHRVNDADRQYTEAGDEASRIAREHGFSDAKCDRLNKEAGLT